MKRFLYIIIVVAFLDTFVQLPIITPYAISLGSSHLLTGAIVAIYSFSNMLGNIVGGHWIDQFGRKKMLLIGMAGVAVILFFYPVAQTGEQLLFFRFIHGLAGGILIPAAFAYVSDLTASRTRGKSMAFTGASIGISAIVGPAFGGIMASKASTEAVFLFVAGLFVVTTFFVIFFLKETYKVPERRKLDIQEFIPLIKHPLVLQASISAFALMVSNGTLAFALPLQVEDIGMSSETTGMLLSVFGIVALIVFLTPINRVYDKYPAINLIMIGVIAISISQFILSFFTSFSFSLISMIIYGFGFALIFPSMNKIVADASAEVDRGKAYGIFYAFFSLGAVAGSFISGAASETIGKPFLVSGIIMLTIMLVIFLLSRTRRTV